MIKDASPVTQALLGTLMTWGLTAAGAAVAFFMKGDQVCTMYVLNSDTGFGVFKRGVENWKGFCLRINILKGNYSILRIGLMGAVFKNQSFES